MSLVPDPDLASLWGALTMRGDRVPAWLLSVADDEYGNLYCLSLRDADVGSVWFWDHEGKADDDEPPTDANLTRRRTRGRRSWPASSWSAEQPSGVTDSHARTRRTPRGMSELFQANPPASGARVTELEQRLGARLPNDYRAYLSQQTAGMPRRTTPWQFAQFSAWTGPRAWTVSGPISAVTTMPPSTMGSPARPRLRR